MKGVAERIDAVYAWIVVHDDGSEGIPAVMRADGMWMPLIGADEARVRSLAPIARRSFEQMLARPETGARALRFIRFTAREELPDPSLP